MAQTLEELDDKLSRELSWRKKEIATVRSAALRETGVSPELCRLGVVLVCAHWEGYLKGSLQHYLDHVFSQDVPLNNLALPLVATYFFKDVCSAGKCDYPGSENHHMRLARMIVSDSASRNVKPRWKVQVDGNPSSTITTNLLRSVGLDEKMGLEEAEWSATRVFIDEQVLKIRHKVAHGEGYPVRPSDFRVTSERVISLCESLTSVVTEGAKNRVYMSPV